MVPKERCATAIPRPLLDLVQRGTMNYRYRGVPTLKNPFDWALYPMLLWEVRPRTIIEIGSNCGGSALWMADMMRAFGLTSEIHSVDLNPVVGLDAPGVVFYGGDARRLEETFSDEFMAQRPRPLLVIEDSDHQMQTTLAVLRFFDRWLVAGEYIVIEDGIIGAMGTAASYGGGPHAAIERFLQMRGDDYDIDIRYCDWFGLNVTWNVNGFLRRRSKRTNP